MRPDGNIPLLIAIIPLYYEAFRDPTEVTFRHWRTSHSAGMQPERQRILEKIYSEFRSCSQMRSQLETCPSRNFMPKYRRTRPANNLPDVFRHVYRHVYRANQLRNQILDRCRFNDSHESRLNWEACVTLIAKVITRMYFYRKRM